MYKSNILRTTRLSRVFSLAVLLCCTLWAAAGEFAGINRLRFAEEKVSISAGEEKTLAVILDNDDAVAAVNFTIVMPDCLELVNAEANNARIPEGTRVLFNPANGKFALTANRGPLLGNSGDPLAYITVKGKDLPLGETGKGSVALNGVVLTDFKGESSARQSSVKADVTVTTGSVKVSATPAGSVINPDGTMKVSVALDNNVSIYALQLDITLPEGFTASEFNIGNRATSGAWIYDTDRHNGTWNLIFINDSGANVPTFDGNSGEVVNFILTAPSEFPDNVTVKINKVVASAAGQVTISDNEGVTFSLTNGKPAYTRALEAVAALRTKFDEALATIAETCPDVKDEFPGTSISEKITNLSQVVDAAYGDLSLTEGYDAVMAPVAGIETEIASLLEDAVKAQAKFEADKAEAERQAANKAAYEADLVAADALQTRLDEAKKTAASRFPESDVTEQTAAAQNAVAAVRLAIETAYESVKTEGIYASTADFSGAIALIDDIVPQSALIAVGKVTASLDEELKEALDKVALNCPDVAEQFTGDDIAADIAAITAKANELYTAGTLVNDYANILDAVSPVREKIAGMLAEADAAQKKFEADRTEAERQAANQAAYDADLETIAAFQTTLDEVNTQVAEEFADFDVTEQQTAAQNAVNTAKEAADAAYAAVEAEGVYNNTVDNDAIAAAIQAIVDRAAELKAEADRKAANKAAYDADHQAIDAHQARLEEVKGILATDYEGHDVSEHVANAQNSIDAAREAADAAFAAVETEGEYAGAIDHEGIAAGIEAILDRAAELKAEAERQAANKEAYDADLETIAGLRTQLEEAVKTCDEQYPNYGYAEEQEAIAAAIDAQQTQADEAYAAVETEGEYSNTVDTAGIETMIEDMLRKAADFSTGVTMINGEKVPADARIFTLDGREYSAPQPGKVNIVVYGDGTVSKVFVK